MPDQTPLDVEAIRAELAAMAGRPWTAEAAEYFIGRLLDENARLNAENERIRATTKLHRESTARQRHNLEQKLIGWREAAEEARAELDKVIREAAADKAALGRCRLAGADLVGENEKLKARVAELEELKCAVCGMRVAHLNCNGHVIGWGCADGEECKPAPEMPRPPAEEAQERPEGTGTGSGRGTGVTEAQGVQADLSLIPADLTQSDPGIRGGEPCITGTRIPAHEVAGYLADGATWDEVREMLPSLPSLPVPSTERTTT